MHTRHPDWPLSALCGQVDADMFHVEMGASTLPAKRICGRCEVRAECLADVMEAEACGQTRDGVYGGLSPNERRRLAATGWTHDDPTPPVQMFQYHAGVCPHCAKQCRSVRMHITSVHPGVRGAA